MLLCLLFDFTMFVSISRSYRGDGKGQKEQRKREKKEREKSCGDSPLILCSGFCLFK